MAKTSEAVVVITPASHFKMEGAIAIIFKLPFQKSGSFDYGMDFKGKTYDVGRRKGKYIQSSEMTELNFGRFDVPGVRGNITVRAHLWAYDGSPRPGGDGEVFRDEKLWFKCKWLYKPR